MLYPAELQALPQPRDVTVAQDFILCLAQDAEKVRQRRSRIAQRLNVRDRVRLASSLAAALLDELFEHPARCSFYILDGQGKRDGREKRDRKFRTLQPSDFLTRLAFLACLASLAV